ncbi:MAG: hypothetical protein HFJ20_04480 [Clostridia bacterium]|nr:hypothetical protein [Clostridia bacterium]
MKGIIQISGKKLTNSLREKIIVACKLLSDSCEVLQSSRKLLHISFKQLPDIISLNNALQSSINLDVCIRTHPFKNIIFVKIL